MHILVHLLYKFLTRLFIIKQINRNPIYYRTRLIILCCCFFSGIQRCVLFSRNTVFFYTKYFYSICDNCLWRSIRGISIFQRILFNYEKCNYLAIFYYIIIYKYNYKCIIFFLQVPKENQEFSMAMTAFSDSIGIALSGLLAIPLHNHICHLPK